jgi:hypothetical protein
MPKAANSDDTHALAGLNVPMPHRREGSDSSTEEGSGGLEVHSFWNLDDKAFSDDDGVGISTEGIAARPLFGTVVCKRRTAQAVLFEACKAIGALVAGIDHTAYTADIAYLESFYLAPDCFDTTENLVAWHARIRGGTPFVAGCVQVGMTNARIKDLQLDIFSAQGPTLKVKLFQKAFRSVTGVTQGWNAILL